MQAKDVRAMFPAAVPDLIKEHPESCFRHADSDGVFFDIWYNEADQTFRFAVSTEQ